MIKKGIKKGLAAYHKRPRTRKSVLATENPPPLEDMVDFVIPGFVGYAGTRFAARVVHTVVSKRMPRLAKHATALSTFAAAGAAWLLVHRFEKVKRYHTPVVVGSSIAALQSAVQAYLPKYGWIVADVPKLAPSPAALPEEGEGKISTSGWSLEPLSAPIVDAATVGDLGSLMPSDAGMSMSDDDIDALLDD